jgi:ethanolamine transporter EutH
MEMILHPFNLLPKQLKNKNQMKKNVLVFGLIAGVIVSGFMAVTIGTSSGNHDSNDMLLGYAAMLVALSFVFVGIKNYRDKYNEGLITFGKAFKIGILISLIASTLYVITWMIMFHFFIPDFMDKYAEHMLRQAQESGASAAEIAAKTSEMNSYKEMYKNPLMVILLTYAEIVPVGLLVTLVSALLLKKKTRSGDSAAVA